MINVTTTTQNRDITQQNKASTLVEACLFSNVTIDSLLLVNKILLSLPKNEISQDIQNTIFEATKMVTLSLESSRTMTKLFSKCSTHVKCDATRIAHNETQSIKRALKNGEVKMLNSRLRHFNGKILEGHSTIFRCHQFITTSSPTQQSSAYTEVSMVNHTSHTDVSMSNHTTQPSQSMFNHTTDFRNQSSSSSTSSVTTPITLLNQDTQTQLTRFHSRFFSNKSYFILPPPLLDCKMYTPKEAIHVINNCSDSSSRMLLDMPMEKGKYIKRKLSQFTIIQLLINKKYVPINKT